MKYCLILLTILSFCVSTKGQMIKASGSTTFCAGGTVSLTVDPVTGITGYQWIKNGRDLPGEINPGYAANTTGTYSVKIKRPSLTDTTIGPMVVTVNPIPTITVNPPAVCVGQRTTLTASGANTYSWAPAANLN